jgi:GT2 family glycosyltransferase
LLDNERRVTTVVATQNRWHRLESTLAQHSEPVVLVDNASTDETVKAVRATFPQVKVIELAENQGACARNVGVRAARTELVAFADDDSWWQPEALQRAVELFQQHPRLALLAGRILVGPQERLDPTCIMMANSPLGTEADLPGPSVLGFLACGSIVRREAFLQAGGFDEVVFFFGEEERLALDLAAAGWGLAYVDEVIAHHHPQPAGNGADRRSLAARNRILTAVMRRPWHVVIRIVAKELVESRANRRGVWDAVPRLRSAMRRRRRLPGAVEASRRMLDAC